MRMVAMTGTRISTGNANRTAIGARGWWSFSHIRARHTSQSLLARRYSPTGSLDAGGLIVLMGIGALIDGGAGAIAALLLGAFVQAVASGETPDGFVCLRCGCEFKPLRHA